VGGLRLFFGSLSFVFSKLVVLNGGDSGNGVFFGEHKSKAVVCFAPLFREYFSYFFDSMLFGCFQKFYCGGA